MCEMLSLLSLALLSMLLVAPLAEVLRRTRR
jgi:hypothetical protein